MATLDQVISQMAAADMPPLPPGHPRIGTDKPVRFGPQKKCWYWIHELQARSGRRYLAGAFGRWQGTDNGKIAIHSDWAGIEPDELQRIQRSQAELERRDREKRAARARFAGLRAIDQWRAGRARLGEGESVPYLDKKRLQFEKGLRVYTDGTLLVPMVRYDVTEEQDADPAYTGPRRLVGLQKIRPDGFKLFNKGMDPVGAACRFGKARDGEIIMLGEGLATVLSAYQGLERAYAAYVAFVAGNLLRIATLLRQQFPNSPIIILADDDAYLEAQLNKRLRSDYGVQELFQVLDVERSFDSKHGRLTVRANLHEEADGAQVLTAGLQLGEQVRTLVLKNTGRTKAREAAAAIGNAWVAFPQFSGRVLGPDPDAPRLTDWNDLHVAEGLARVVDQVGGAVKLIEDAHELSKALATGQPPPAEGAAAGGGKGGADEPDWHLHGSLIRRFTLVERSGSAWDADRGFLWKIEHMRLSFGTKAVNMWLGSPRTRKIDASMVVFDPTGTADPARTVNLFRGLQMKPGAPDACSKLLRLGRYLCGEDEATHTPISDWVFRWCAYQVQHVGAKMRTAIVMYGPEGTGKNQFWSAMQDIFHPYSAQIGQAELEDKFNGWLSARLFLLANEVVTRAELSHHVGKLKAYVTEPFLHIRTAYMDARYEANHANLVFLSNEFQPLKISPGDRRYMVIRTPPVMDASFYKEVAAELRAGGAASFMRYLRELDLGDFNEHTKPIITDAKRDLIEIGMLPSQLFWQEIKDGILQLPYCPALSDDVYRAYYLWTLRRGHKMPEAQNRFTQAFMSMNGVRRGEPRVPDPEKLNELQLAEKKLKKRRVLFMGERLVIHHPGEDQPDKYATEREWMVAGIKSFRLALRAFESEGAADSRGAARANQQEPAF